MSERTVGEPTLLQEDEELLGQPSFEIWVRDGRPIVSGSYFVQPPLRAIDAQWDPERPERLQVRADDGSEWFAEDVPHVGSVSVRLQPVSGTHRAYAPE